MFCFGGVYFPGCFLQVSYFMLCNCWSTSEHDPFSPNLIAIGQQLQSPYPHPWWVGLGDGLHEPHSLKTLQQAGHVVGQGACYLALATAKLCSLGGFYTSVTDPMLACWPEFPVSCLQENKMGTSSSTALVWLPAASAQQAQGTACAKQLFESTTVQLLLCLISLKIFNLLCSMPEHIPITRYGALSLAPSSL